MEESWATIAERYDRRYRKVAVLSEQQNHRCCYCGTEMFLARRANDFERVNVATIEHVTPKIKGGERGYQNEVAACRVCNNLRSADDATEFFVWRLQHLDETPKQLFNSIRKHRKKRHKAEKAAERAAIHQQRLDAAFRTPYLYRVINLAMQQAHSLLKRLVWSVGKYRQNDITDETDRNRSGSKRRHKRNRHRAQNAVGDSNADHQNCLEAGI